MGRSIRGATLVAAAIALLAAKPETSPTVKTDKGMVSGATNESGVAAYLGIPFAAPPTGNLRWREPQRAAHWDGVRKSEQFGASCMQNEAGSRLPWTEEFMTQGPISEDCLYLNVWSSAKSGNAKQAVMVYIYGGGFNEGSGAITVYHGDELAKKGVVVVTFNYRVGPLGFLAYPELTKESEHHSSGNYGLLDQIAALEWVHRNIAAFGGDPQKVTIFGQSAGAASVGALIRSPLTQGLFAHAIAESGLGLLPSSLTGAGVTLAEREQQGVAYAESKGAHSLADLRAIPAAEFFKSNPGNPGLVRGPAEDGWVLTKETPAQEVPLIDGMVANDVGVAGGGRGESNTTSAYEADAQKVYGNRAAEFLKLYPAGTDGDVMAERKASGTDRARVSIDLWAKDQSKRSPAIYIYYFDRPIPWPAHPEFGAFHTSDVPYIFEKLKTLDRPWTPVDFKVSNMMSSYWTNFAKTGNPNGPDVPQWTAYDASSHSIQELGEHTGPIAEADGAKLKFFLDFYGKD